MNCTAISNWWDATSHIYIYAKGIRMSCGVLLWLLAPIYQELAGFREIKENIILGHVWDSMWWFITLDNSL